MTRGCGCGWGCGCCAAGHRCPPQRQLNAAYAQYAIRLRLIMLLDREGGREREGKRGTRLSLLGCVIYRQRRAAKWAFNLVCAATNRHSDRLKGKKKEHNREKDGRREREAVRMRNVKWEMSLPAFLCSSDLIPLSRCLVPSFFLSVFLCFFLPFVNVACLLSLLSNHHAGINNHRLIISCAQRGSGRDTLL